jgi:hypothetical protein
MGKFYDRSEAERNVLYILMNEKHWATFTKKESYYILKDFVDRCSSINSVIELLSKRPSISGDQNITQYQLAVYDELVFRVIAGGMPIKWIDCSTYFEKISEQQLATTVLFVPNKQSEAKADALVQHNSLLA